MSASRLQELIVERMRELDVSYTELGRRAGLPRSTVHAVATKSQAQQRPKPETLDAIAAALELPAAMLREAAVEAAGYGFAVEPIDAGDDRLRSFVATVRELDERDRETLAVIARQFAERARAEREALERKPSQKRA